jgi:hypothetical protein
MAVPVGFEPTVGSHPHNFSRVAPSAARTRYRGLSYARARYGANPPNLLFAHAFRTQFRVWRSVCM